MIFPAARRPRTVLAARTLAVASTLGLALATGPVVTVPVIAQEGAAAVQDVTLTDVTFPLGGTTVRIPKLVASGTRLSRDDLAAIFRAGSPEPWAARLARLDASSLTAPVLVADYAGPKETRQTTTYREVMARNVRAGKIGELVAAGATLTIGSPDPASKGGGTYGALRATDVDLTALARLAAEAGDGKGPVLPIYGSLQVSDIAFTYERGTTVKIARFDGRDIGARQVPGGWNGALDNIAAPGADPAADPAVKRGALSAGADLLAATAIGGFDLRSLSVSDSSRGTPVLTEIGRIGFASGGPEAGLTLDDLTVSGGATRTHLGKVRLAGTAMAPFIAALRRIAADPDGTPSVSEMRDLAAGLGTLTLTDLVTDLPDDPPPAKRGALETPSQKQAEAAARPLVKSRVVETRPDVKAGDPLAVVPPPTNRITLREASLGPVPAGAGAPGSTRLSLTGLSLPASLVAGQPLIGALPAYGFGDLDLDVAADAAWDESARTVTLNEVSVSGRDIGRVKVTGQFGGIGPELFSGSVPAQTMLMFSGSARALDVTVENSGLFERFLAAQAKDLSLKPDELRKEYVTASVLGVPVILGNGPAAKEIGAAMGQFVVNPGKLTLRAKAKEPTGLGFIDIGTARSPGAVLDRLDVEARAN